LGELLAGISIIKRLASLVLSDPESAVDQEPLGESGDKAILVALSFTSILAGLEIGCIATAMPTMVKELGSGDSSDAIYVWVANAYFLTMTAFQVSSTYYFRLSTSIYFTSES
jgi:hypothetical protein